jgi:hypothetical protein
MIKTQVQLEDWQYRAAKEESARTSRSLSDLVREGLTTVLRKASARQNQSLEQLAGKYEPRLTSDLKPHDRGWAESVR